MRTTGIQGASGYAEWEEEKSYPWDGYIRHEVASLSNILHFEILLAGQNFAYFS